MIIFDIKLVTCFSSCALDCLLHFNTLSDLFLHFCMHTYVMYVYIALQKASQNKKKYNSMEVLPPVLLLSCTTRLRYQMLNFCYDIKFQQKKSLFNFQDKSHLFNFLVRFFGVLYFDFACTYSFCDGIFAWCVEQIVLKPESQQHS